MNCYMMVGLPALGKSTKIKELEKQYQDRSDYWIYSTDMYIDAVAEDNGITYSQAFEDNIKAATEYNDKNLNIAIKLKKDIIWDQTNLGLTKRKKIITKMKNAGYKVHCIYIKAPDKTFSNSKELCDEWATRLESREGKVIPTPVMVNMIKNLVEPSIQEGYDSFTAFDMNGKLLFNLGAYYN